MTPTFPRFRVSGHPGRFTLLARAGCGMTPVPDGVCLLSRGRPSSVRTVAKRGGVERRSLRASMMRPSPTWTATWWTNPSARGKKTRSPGRRLVACDLVDDMELILGMRSIDNRGGRLGETQLCQGCRRVSSADVRVDGQVENGHHRQVDANIFGFAGGPVGAEVPLLAHDFVVGVPPVWGPPQNELLGALVVGVDELQPDPAQVLWNREQDPDRVLSRAGGAPAWA